MYLSITNIGHKKTKYFIVDQTEEFNLPNIPQGYSLAFQEKYKTEIKIVNDENLKKIFKNNTLLYEIVFFNSDFKLNKCDVKEQIKNKYNNFFENTFKIDNSFNLKLCNSDIIDFVNKPVNIYNKVEINTFISSLQNKINRINHIMNIFDEYINIITKTQIYETLENTKNEINLIKNTR